MRRHPLLLAVPLVALVLAAGMFLWLRSGPPPKPGTFRVGYQPTMLYLPVFVAQEQGLFRKHGLNVAMVRFGSANEMAQALATQKIDATGMSSLTVLANLEKNSADTFRIYLVEVLTKDKSPDALVVQSGSEILSLLDLRGKRLGIHPGTTLRAYADRLLRNTIGEDHGVIFTPLQPQIQVQALAAGSVDALYTIEPIPTRAEARTGARIIARGLLASYLHDPFYAGAGVLATSVVESNPDAVASYRAAIREALQLIATDEQRARQVMAAYASVSPETAQRMALVQWVEPLNVPLSEWRTTIESLVDMGLMPKEVALEQTFLGD